MKYGIYILIAIFAMFCFSNVMFAGAADTTKKAADTKVIKSDTATKKVSKPSTLRANPKRYLTANEVKEIKAAFDTLEDDAAMTVGMFRDGSALNHDQTLVDAHNELVSMDGMFKDQMTVRYAAKLAAVDSLHKALVAKNAATDTLAKELQKKLATLEWFYDHLSKQMDGIGTAVLVTAKATNAVAVKAAEEWEFTPEQKGYFQGLNKFLEDVAKDQK
jgi:hypothetical protein